MQSLGRGSELEVVDTAVLVEMDTEVLMVIDIEVLVVDVVSIIPQSESSLGP